MIPHYNNTVEIKFYILSIHRASLFRNDTEVLIFAGLRQIHSYHDHLFEIHIICKRLSKH